MIFYSLYCQTFFNLEVKYFILTLYSHNTQIVWLEYAIIHIRDLWIYHPLSVFTSLLDCGKTTKDICYFMSFSTEQQLIYNSLHELHKNMFIIVTIDFSSLYVLNIAINIILIDSFSCPFFCNLTHFWCPCVNCTQVSHRNRKVSFNE